MRRLWAQLIACMLLAAPLTAIAATRQGYIETPSACYVPEKIQGETVGLKAVGVCDGKPGRAFVQTDMPRLKVYVDGSFWKEVPVEDIAVSDVSASLAKAGQLAGTLAVPRNATEEEMRGVAERFNTYYRSEEFQGRVRSETERIRNKVFGESFASFYPDSVAETGKGGLGESERVYVFVSSSMPIETVRNYVASVSRLRDTKVVMVMRGFVGGMAKIQPTIGFVTSVLKEDPSCTFADKECRMRSVNLVVDPLLFRRYGIDMVPAVVYARGLRSVDAALSEGNANNTSVSEDYTVFGDAALEYVLEMIGRESGASSLRDLAARK